jgi:hypothetical protein
MKEDSDMVESMNNLPAIHSGGVGAGMSLQAVGLVIILPQWTLIDSRCTSVRAGFKVTGITLLARPH